MSNKNILKVTTFVEIKDSVVRIHYALQKQEGTELKKHIMELPLGGEEVDLLYLFIQVGTLSRTSKYFQHWVPQIEDSVMDKVTRVIEDKLWLETMEGIADTVKEDIKYLGLTWMNENSVISNVISCICSSIYYYSKGKELGCQEVKIID